MPIVTRIACSVAQNVKYMQSVRMKKIRKNAVSNECNNNNSNQKNTSSNNDNSKLIATIVPISAKNTESSTDIVHTPVDMEAPIDTVIERKVESKFQSDNMNLVMKTKIIDEGDRIIVQVNTEWFDPKTNKAKKQLSQSVYDIWSRTFI